MTLGMIMAAFGLAALIVAVVMLVRRDPDAAQVWDESRSFVQESYTAFRNKELGSLEDSIDDVSLGDFFTPDDRKRLS
ncbi:hypothetical protein EJO69_04985 [Flaviflexus salsibiostraticola]|uniref:Uncharacterized protein n=1 Tax=Flaviflexus salsibiostraticola TaxID=1282737 RepID=A0A3S8Z8G7_9ACTO|nr:hypothetical protein [Flaviflexus salsibiostraticola]AZN29734.1 hypothetical protein EJO69_04985 [Flaviflexus salsibiostraticola]